MNNAARKGGVPDVMKIVYTIPALEDLWQLHFSLLGGQEYAVPGIFIANTLDDQPDAIAIAPISPIVLGQRWIAGRFISPGTAETIHKNVIKDRIMPPLALLFRSLL